MSVIVNACKKVAYGGLKGGCKLSTVGDLGDFWGFVPLGGYY